MSATSIQRLGQIETTLPFRADYPPTLITRPESARNEVSIWIADLVYKHYARGLDFTLWQSCKFAAGEIPPEQRFYEIEVVGAAHRLAELIPEHNAISAWAPLLNTLGSRIVPVRPCTYGEIVDPVTRQCVAEYEPPPVIIEPPEPEPEPRPAITTAGMLAVGLGVAALLLLSR